MLPGVEDEPDLLLDEGPEAVDGLLVEIGGEDPEHDLGPAEDGLPQLPGLLQLLKQFSALLNKLLNTNNFVKRKIGNSYYLYLMNINR